MKAMLVILLVCMTTAAWGWLPSQGPKQPPRPAEVEASRVPVVVEPTQLLVRIEALELRLAQAEKQIAALQAGHDAAKRAANPKP